MTTYKPARMWRIDGIKYEMNPLCTFKTKDGDITFQDYFSKRYHVELKHLNQPLILNKDRRTGRESYLLPELLQLTGLDEKAKSNYHLTKQLDSYTKPGPSVRLAKTREIIDKINLQQSEKIPQREFIETEESKKEKEYQKQYMEFLSGVKISKDPQQFQAKQINAGHFLMGNNETVQFNDDLERKLQRNFLIPAAFKRWAIVLAGNKPQLLETFQTNISEASKTYKITLPPPKVIFIQSQHFSEWRDAMKDFDKFECQMVLLILPGQKKAAPLYNDLKKYLISEKGIPSQVIIESTLNGKSLRSICNKVLVQMTAKMGGIPWTMNELPFIDRPTIVVGIDVYHRTFNGVQKSIFAFVATMNITYSRYYSLVKIQEAGQEIGTFIEDCCKKSIAKFQQIWKKQPTRMIIYRDGVSVSQRNAVKTLEIDAIQRGTSNIPDFQILFITVDKRANAKFYDAPNLSNVQSCKQGTVIDDPAICGEEDFFMVSARANQGIASPIHYYILHDDLKATASNQTQHKSKIQLLTFKLCHMYYNWSGAIKVPAPCIYAHKLSNLVGDKWGESANFNVHQKLQENGFLYYI
eukprot:TRINITY_DN3243_c0_g1_i3.p1 TRINITY_DN3243_c0_g1~~TRINITY_DN3243_c0_g1_i3.p1  ORF type:complete len:581 (+),score=82.81 TRINITY_DN3243_c0_g1_i3:530-2272(+)